MMEARRKREANEARKAKEEDDVSCQKFQKKKRNVESLIGTKEKLIEVQAAKKRKEENKNEELIKLSEEIEDMAVKNKAAEK